MRSLFKHRVLVQVHGYVAVFFLPMALLYAMTGALYVIGIKGAAPETRIAVPLENSWPATDAQARAFVTDRLQANGLPALSSAAGHGMVVDTEYYWLALTHWVILTKIDDKRAELVVRKNSPLRQAVEIHKDHAGAIFTVIGFTFGLAMLLMIVSGAVMMFRAKSYRKTAVIVVACGSAMSVLAYLAAVTVR